MAENLADSLEITVIGMSLVFAAIILLWGVMSLLVRFTAEEDDDTPEPAAISPDEMELKRRAAIAAVMVALIRDADTQQPHAFPLPPTAVVSAWQAVQRSRQLTEKGPRK
jgi:Na+-transporting methylmalonyl-CoA/oxaloacetate decarboxylase gamma subunit